jgi:hypothetical protein
VDTTGQTSFTVVRALEESVRRSKEHAMVVNVCRMVLGDREEILSTARSGDRTLAL